MSLDSSNWLPDHGTTINDIEYKLIKRNFHLAGKIDVNFIRQTFSSGVSETYELVNHILTWGQAALWRRRAVKMADQSGGTRWVDMCTGTGDMAVCLRRMASADTEILAVDFSTPMMAKARAKPEAVNIDFVVSDVYDLCFPDGSFDLVTISFATRNINRNRKLLVHAFSEFYRVLKPGGWFINLETSQPSSRLIRNLFHLYVRIFVKPVGRLISGSPSAYAYLAHTITRFYPPGELAAIMASAGFEDVTHKKLFFGVAAIHRGIKG